MSTLISSAKNRTCRKSDSLSLGSRQRSLYTQAKCSAQMQPPRGSYSEATAGTREWLGPQGTSQVAADSHAAQGKTHPSSSRCFSPLFSVTLCSPCRNFGACLSTLNSIQRQDRAQNRGQIKSAQQLSKTGATAPGKTRLPFDLQFRRETLIGQQVLSDSSTSLKGTLCRGSPP